MDFNPGDIVEHKTYPGVYFEVVATRAQVFDNIQFVDVRHYGGTPDHLTPSVQKLFYRRFSEANVVCGAHHSNLREPLNGMEVLAVAWAKGGSE